MRVPTRQLRNRAVWRAQEAHTFWMHTGRKSKNCTLDFDRDGCQYICTMTIDGTEPLPYRQWTVYLKSNGALISAHHNA